MEITQLIRQVQRELAINVDGKAGPQTWEAIYRRIVPRVDQARGADMHDAATNARSEEVIATLEPVVQPYARALYFKARENGITINVISGLRSFEQQDAIYAQGRTLPGPVVSNARAGHSVHNFGLAFDVGVFAGRRYLPDSPAYKAVGALGMELGLEWGGNWKTPVDQPHFQLRPSWAENLTDRQMLAQLRERHHERTSLA